MNKIQYMTLQSVRRLGRSIYRSLYFPPVVIALAILVATLITWQSSYDSLNKDIEDAVRERITATEQAIASTVGSYEQVLLGGVGLFQGSSEVTAADWNNYIGAFDTGNRYPSAQSFGFISVVRQHELPAFTERMRAHGPVPDFTVHPEGEREVYAPLSFVYAVALRTVPSFGLDLYTDPVRRGALERAGRTNTTAITSRLTLTPSNESQTYQGFAMYAPYYAVEQPVDTPEEREAALRGYVYAGFRANLFFGNIATDADTNTSGYRVRVAQDTTDLYTSARYENVTKLPHTVKVTQPLNVLGETWNVEYVFGRSGLVSEVQLRRPSSVLLAGAFTALLIGMVVLLLLRARAQELAAQKEQAVELAKDELLSLASHQLRTPATGVKQYVGMVLQGFAGKVPKEQLSLLEKAYASNDRQLNIINEILHLAKIDSGRIVLARQETDFGALVEDIVNEQRPDIAAAKHTISLRLPKKPLVLYIDAHTLRMAIENILSNAIKYTPEGGTITVRLHRDETHAHLRIKDSGVGIAPADLDKLFKQFSRLPNEMSLRVGGTGIGLYLAKHLIELHGGIIHVASAQGKGSTFSIILPLDMLDDV